jgi:deazaflavin-dependent oxidoreductase (nitroreductase family)
MPLTGDYEPSTSNGVREQVDLYERSEGTKGATIAGRPVVVVTSRGARSGKLRKNPVMRVEHEGCYAAVASLGGAPGNPQWYHNMLAEPLVEVQDGAVKRYYTARLLQGDEKQQWWERAVEAFPRYEQYRVKTKRDIPVFVLEPAE